MKIDHLYIAGQLPEPASVDFLEVSSAVKPITRGSMDEPPNYRYSLSYFDYHALTPPQIKKTNVWRIPAPKTAIRGQFSLFSCGLA